MFKLNKFLCFLFAFLLLGSGLKAQMDVAPTNGVSPKKQVIQNKRLMPLDFTYNLADSILAYDPAMAANGNAGVIFFNGEFWISKWASNEIVILDPQASVDTVITIPGLTGTRSFTTDGVSIFAGNATSNIYAIDPLTRTLDSTIILPAASVGSRMTTYDPNADNGNGGFWIANFTSDIELYSRTGTLLQTITQTTHGVDGIYGGAVDTITPGGPYLALYNQGVVDQARIDYIDIATGTPAGFVYNTHMDLNFTQATNPNPAIAGGLFISDSYNPNHQVIMGVLQGQPDILFGYENLIYNCPQSSNITATAISATEVELSWTAGGGANWNIEYGPSGFTPGTGTVFNTTSTTDTISGLTAGLSYDFYVEDSCSMGQVSFWSGPATVTLGYCLPAPTSVDGDGITNVSIGTINNATLTEPNNYGDYSNLITDVARSTFVNVDITFSTGLTYETRVWVDWNNDFDFDDAGEEVFTGTSLGTNPATISASFLVPSTAVLDTLRMRIGGTDFAVPTPCYTGSWASYEDYSLNILPEPSCLPPYGLTASDLTHNSAVLSWSILDTSSSWEVEYGSLGFTPGIGIGTDFITLTNPDTITGLTSLTQYDFYVRTICGPNDTSAWAGPFTFMTLCSPIAAPYTEDFDNAGAIPTCWEQGANNLEDWLFDNTYGFNHIGNNGNVNSSSQSGGYFAWVDDSFPDNVGTTLESPLIDVSSLSLPTLSFYMISHNEGNSNVDFSVDVWDGSAWNIGEFVSDTNTLSGEWEEVVVPLSHLTITGPIKVRFIVDENNGSDFFDDIAIDDFTIDEEPSCLKPTSLYASNISSDSAVIGWTENNIATEWVFEYGTLGFTPGTGTIDTALVNPISITGLTPNTTYQFYIRSICGRNDTSKWAGPLQFITECAAVTTYPYMQGFGTYVPPCWEEADNGTPATGPTNFGFSAWFQDDFMNDPSNGVGININLFFTGKEDWIISEPFDLSGSSSQPYQLKMKAGITDWNSTMPGTMDSDDEVQVLISTDGGLTWNNLYTWDATNQPTHPATYVFIPLGAYTGNNNLIALWGSEGASGGTVDIQFFVDNFEIRETPTCQEVTNVSVNNIGSFSADLSWTENNSATEWEIEYGTSGFTFGTGIDSIVSTNPKTLNGLAPNTNYEFYVRSICAPGDTSFWMGPFSFMTLLPPCAGTPNAVSLNVPSSVCAGIGFELEATGATLANGISYEWQVYDSTSASWVSTGLTNTSDSITSGIFVPTSYRMITYCSFSGMSDTSSVAYITINPPLQCYCTPTYSFGCSGGDDINSVTLAGAFGTSINDLNTGCAPNDYDDKTSLTPVVMEIDSTYSGTISSSYTFLSEYANIWIDFGDDGNFDATDLVASVGPFANTAVPFNITIPLGVDSGFHRMRIRNVYGGSSFSFDACNNENWGETHDYMVYIGTLTPCAGEPDSTSISAPSNVCPLEPFSITASGMSFGLGISYTWEESIDGTNVWTSISGATGSNFSVPGGISDTMQYRMITVCNSSGLADTSNVVTISINPPTQCYCDPIYSTGCAFGDDIKSVTLIGVNSTSINDMNTGCSANSYDDKTNLPAVDLVAGMTHYGAINSNFTGLSEYAKIWIDFGDDGNFDTSDFVGQVGPFSTAAMPFTISIPTTADSGLHRMRIRSVWNATGFTFDACSSESYGETHDYMAKVIIPDCPVPNTLNVDSLTYSSGILEWTENGISTEWQIEYGLFGFLLGNGTRDTVITKPVPISNLLPDTTYQFYVRSVCGRNDTSYWAGPFSFTTPCTPTSTYPYVQTFGTLIPDCWQVADEGEIATGPTDFGITDWFQNDFLNNTTRGDGLTINLYSDFHRDWVISEPFDLSGGTSPYELLIDAGVTDWLGTAADSMGSDDEVQVLISTDRGNTWNNLYTWNVTNQPPNTGSTVTIPLNSYTGSHNLFAIWASDGIVDDANDYEFHISNFTIDFITGINQPENSLSNISIYPNPSKGIFHVVGSQVKEQVEISIFNTNGKLIYQSSDKFSNNFDERIDISGFAKGLYFVKLQSESSMEMKKIIIQ